MSEKGIFSLECPKCGAALTIPPGLSTFKCNYCNSTVRLIHNETITALKLISTGIHDVKEGTNTIALELRYKRILSEFTLQKDVLISIMDNVWKVWDFPDWFGYKFKVAIIDLYEKQNGKTCGIPPTFVFHKKFRGILIDSFSTNEYLELIGSINKTVHEGKRLRSKDMRIIKEYILELNKLIKQIQVVEMLTRELKEIKAILY